MNKIISILSILLFFTVTNFAQTTVSISDTTSADSTEITIPVNVSGALDSVASLSIFISYDTSVLDYQDIVDNPFAGSNFTVNDNNGVISVSWFSLTPVDVTNKLFSIKFFYKGGSSNLDFTGTNQITNLLTPFNVTFVNGSIGAEPATMSLGTVSGNAGDTVMVSYSGTNLKDLASITTFIDYDTAAVEYVGLASETVDFQDNATAGQVGLAWFDTTPFTLNSGDLAVLKFVVVSGSTDLTFNTQSQATDLNGNTLSITYTNGKVTEIVPVGAVPTLALDSVYAEAGAEVSVPLNGIKITDMGSFTINVSYDTTVLTYVRIDNLVSGTMVDNATNGVLSMAWFDTTPLSIDGAKFADLVFTYKGGMSDLTMSAVQITNGTGGDITSTITLVPGNVDFLVGVDEPTTLPENYSLEQNYPNPFNPSTTISFSLKENSTVTLSVYNMLGQKIQTLVNSELSSGYKSVNFDASNLSSGIYLYRLNVVGVSGSNFIATKKMMLMK